MTSALWIAVGMAVVATGIAIAYLPRHQAPATPDRHGHGHGKQQTHHQHSLELALFQSRHQPRRSRVAIVGLALLAAGCARTTADSTAPTSVRPSTTTTVTRPSAPVDELVAVHGARLQVQCT